ncbi:uncharacterized protein LOC120331650 isoform X1 [Styela clava]
MDDGPKKGNIPVDKKALEELEPSVDEPESQELSATPHKSQLKDQVRENTKKPDKEKKPALEENPKKKAFLAEVADKAVPFGVELDPRPLEEEIEPEHGEDAILEGNQPPHDQNAILEEIEIIRQDIGNLRQEFRDEVGVLRNGMNQIMALLMEQNQQRQQNQQPSGDMGQQPSSDMGQSNRDRQ